MRLRQFVFVAEQLEPAVEEISAVLGLEVCYQDPGVGAFGLENALLPIGGNFLEVVAPTKDGTSAGRYLQRRGGNGGYMVIAHCKDALAERTRITGHGIRDVWRHDGPEAFATHFHPADVGGTIISIDSMDNAASGLDYHNEMADWTWAGPAWADHIKTDVSRALVGLDMQSGDPDGMAAVWSKVFDRPVVGGHGPRITLDNAMLRFVEDKDGRGPGVGGMTLAPQNRPAIMAEADRRGLVTGDNTFILCGMRVRLI